MTINIEELIAAFPGLLTDEYVNGSDLIQYLTIELQGYKQ